MRILAATLGILILLIQVPLWLGKGSWLRVWQVENELSRQKTKIAGSRHVTPDWPRRCAT